MGDDYAVGPRQVRTTVRHLVAEDNANKNMNVYKKSLRLPYEWVWFGSGSLSTESHPNQVCIGDVTMRAVHKFSINNLKRNEKEALGTR